jgi:asparagine synthase (glutamine-hydrolysing)
VAGFAVVIDRTGRAVNSHIVDAVRGSLAHRGPDGVRATSREGAAVVHAALHSTPEAQRERHPLSTPAGGWVVADARIDNRTELARALKWDGPIHAATDLDLLAASLTRWRARAGERLVGDFAVVEVSSDGSVLALRDHLGVKPLYYWVSERWIMLASELRQIASHPDLKPVPNPSIMGQYLSGWVESATETVVRGVQRLPAGHSLVIRDGVVKTSRYWQPPLDVPLELRHDAEYEEQFRFLFTEAVRCRVRAPAGVACELSGGLDSTSVTAVAHSIRSDVTALSCLFPAMPRTDERTYIDAAVRELGLPWRAVVSDARQPTWAWDDAAFWSDIPLPPDGPEHVQLARAARAQGDTVVLTGQGGDQWFDGADLVLPDLVQSLRLVKAWNTAGYWVTDYRHRPAVLAERGIRPLLPAWVHRPWAQRARWVVGEARDAAGLDENRHPARLPREYRRLAAQRRYEAIAGGYDSMSREIFDRAAAVAGVEARHPYLDVRLVEFGCRVPTVQHHTPDRSRRLQRDGLAGILPAEIVDRRSKASFSEVWLREVERHLPEGEWDRTRLAELGWIDWDATRRILGTTRTAIATGAGGGQAAMLWGMVQVEAALRSLAR